MKIIHRVFSVVHAVMAGLFACASLLLIVIASKSVWTAVIAGLDREAAQGVIEGIGLLAAAVVALQIAQTITEEEVMRDSHISGPTRVRRFLSRFLVVLVVAIAIEALVVTFKASNGEMANLVYAACILFAVAVLLAAWGFFIRMNCSAEMLEPDAMAAAKKEDKNYA